MSTIRVNTIQSTSTTNGGISIDSSGHVTLDGQKLPSAGPLSNRNLVINGAMQVAQRGTSETGLGATNNVYATVDRFKHFTGNTAGRFTAEQINVTDLPGFTKALRLSCTTADTTIAANEFMGINHVLEGQDLQQLKKGTSDAESLMLSFYVKGNAAATYTFELRDLDNDRLNTRTFAVTTSWVKIEIPLAGDTTGAIDNDNGPSFQLAWWLHAGSDYTSGTFANTNTWAARTQANRVSSSGNSFFDSTDRTFELTGVQLEVGSVATPFEHRSYGDELQRCQRYYYRISYGTAVTSFGAGFNQTNQHTRNMVCFPVTMRTSPSALEQSGTASDYGAYVLTTTNTCAVVPVFTNASTHGAEVQLQMSSGAFTAGQGTVGVFRTSDAFLAWSAEL